MNSNARKQIFNTFQEKYRNEWQPVLQFYISPGQTLVQPNITGYDRLVGPWASQMYYERIGTMGETA